MQEFTYEGKYDCVWVQWCALYLTDVDLLDFFIRTRDALETSDDLDPEG